MHIVIFYADNFHKVLSSTLVHQQVNFNFESTFVKQYFGTDHSHELSYEEFIQLLQVWYMDKILCHNMIDQLLLNQVHAYSIKSHGSESRGQVK